MSAVTSSPNSKTLQPFHSIRLWLVQLLARWQVGELLEMLRPQGFRDRMFGVEPFAEVNKLAALRTERAESAGEPVAGFFAARTFYLRHRFIWFRPRSFSDRRSPWMCPRRTLRHPTKPFEHRRASPAAGTAKDVNC